MITKEPNFLSESYLKCLWNVIIHSSELHKGISYSARAIVKEKELQESCEEEENICDPNFSAMCVSVGVGRCCLIVGKINGFSRGSRGLILVLKLHSIYCCQVINRKEISPAIIKTSPVSWWWKFTDFRSDDVRKYFLIALGVNPSMKTI